MTSKTITIAGTDRELDRFPEFPPRDDMRNWKLIYRNAQATALMAHLGNPETTIAVSEAPVRPNPRERGTFASPTSRWPTTQSRTSLMRTGDTRLTDRASRPDFVLEVASRTTGETGCTDKRLDYER